MSTATLDPWMAARMGLAAPLTRAAVDAWGLARLNQTIAHARAASPFYRARRDFPDSPLSRIEELDAHILYFGHGDPSTQGTRAIVAEARSKR